MLPSDNKLNNPPLKRKVTSPNPRVSISLSFVSLRGVTSQKESSAVEIIQKDRANVDFVILFGAGLVYKRAWHRLLWGSKESQREWR